MRPQPGRAIPKADITFDAVWAIVPASTTTWRADDFGLPTVPVTELTFDGGYIHGGD
jgi:hypothetical protein